MLHGTIRDVSEIMWRRRRFLKKLVGFGLLIAFVYFCKQIPSSMTPFVRKCEQVSSLIQAELNIEFSCSKDCRAFRFKDNSYIDNLMNIWNSFGDRHKTIQFHTVSDDRDEVAERRAVLKYRMDTEKLERLRESWSASTAETVLRRFLATKEFTGQPHFCLNGGKSALDVMLTQMAVTVDTLFMANMNFEIILLKFLNDSGLPVPKYLAHCGLYLMESYDGLTMDHFYQSDLRKRMTIAKNLIKGAVQMTHGFQGFRIYLTDATKDNIAVNEGDLSISFIDLDDVIVQHVSLFPATNASKLPQNAANSCHRHEIIECDNCFAYSTQDICSHPESDINIFTICQLLLENLTRNRAKGFLYVPPEDLAPQIRDNYATIVQLLTTCVYCDRGQCPDRMELAHQLVTLIVQLLQDFQ